MVRLEVHGPDGDAADDYRRIAVLGAGQTMHRFVIRTAVNDPPGRWLIKVVDVTTGRVATGVCKVEPFAEEVGFTSAFDGD